MFTKKWSKEFKEEIKKQYPHLDEKGIEELEKLWKGAKKEMGKNVKIPFVEPR